MPNNVLEWITAGLDRVEMHVLDSNGVIGGTTGTVTNGAVGSPGFRLYGAKVAPITAPDPDTVPVTGDNVYLGGFVFPSAATRTFRLDGAISELNVNQLLGTGKTYNVGNSSLGFLDVTPFSPVNVALIAVSDAKSQQAGSVGQGLYGGIIVPKAQGIPTGRETMQERAAGMFRWTFIMSLTDSFPWGETFNATTHGVTGATYIPWSSTYRKSFHRFNGDNATLAFGPLQYTPASTSVNDVIVYLNGYRVYTGYTVSQATKMITFGSAPGTGVPICVYYDYVL